jgi:hypothetical protein
MLDIGRCIDSCVVQVVQTTLRNFGEITSSILIDYLIQYMLLKTHVPNSARVAASDQGRSIYGKLII